MIGWDTGPEMFSVDFELWTNADNKESKPAKSQKIVP